VAKRSGSTFGEVLFYFPMSVPEFLLTYTEGVAGII
jgi:hypothetical protein